MGSDLIALEGSVVLKDVASSRTSDTREGTFWKESHYTWRPGACPPPKNGALPLATTFNSPTEVWQLQEKKEEKILNLKERKNYAGK